MIELKGVNFNYVSFEKRPGLKGSINDLFHRKKIEIPALKQFNLTIDSGEIVGLIGPNGAGKTTLTKLLTGIISPSSGQVRVGGFQPDKKEKAFLKDIGVLFGQKSQLSWDLPAIDTLNMLASIYELPKDRFQRRLTDLATMLDAKEIIYRPVRKLSLGQRVKCDLMCALIHSPKYLFLDEPTIGLDLVAQENIYNFLRQENRLHQTTIIITSHNVRDIEALAQRLMIVSKGSLIFNDSLDKLPIDVSKQKFFNVKYLSAEKMVQARIPEAELTAVLSKVKADELIEVSREGISLEELILEIYKNENS